MSNSILYASCLVMVCISVEGRLFPREDVLYTERGHEKCVRLEEGMWHSAVDENGDEMREDLKEFLLKEAREITIALSKFLQEEV